MSVKVRLTGTPSDVARVAGRLHEELSVESESKDYPNRNDDGVRRYLEVSMKAVTDPKSDDNER